jgi:hypothetical protein
MIAETVALHRMACDALASGTNALLERGRMPCVSLTKP